MFEHRKKSCEAAILLVWDYAYNSIISKKLRESSFSFLLYWVVFSVVYLCLTTMAPTMLPILFFLLYYYSEVIVFYNHEPLLLLCELN